MIYLRRRRLLWPFIVFVALDRIAPAGVFMSTSDIKVPGWCHVVNSVVVDGGLMF